MPVTGIETPVDRAGRDMQVLVNGVRLFFDVEGASLVPDGPAMREKPTLMLLHGGPGLDHSLYKPRFSQLADQPLERVRCPTLVLGGEEDPMTPIECQADIVAALPAHLVRFERFSGCGHGVVADAPERALAVIRDFIVR